MVQARVWYKVQYASNRAEGIRCWSRVFGTRYDMVQARVWYKVQYASNRAEGMQVKSL